MGFTEAISTCLNKYATFSGRAPRSEYWWFYLFTFLIGLAALPFDYVLGNEFISNGVSLAFLVPTLAAGSRRLHDTDKSGWLQLLPLIGIVFLFFSSILGIVVILALVILLIVMLATKGNPGDNRFGPDPLQPFDPTVFD